MKKSKVKSLFFYIFLFSLLISCGSSKQIFEFGSVKTLNSIENIKINYNYDLPLCKVFIGGKQYVFLVDTGAPTVIPTEIFSRLKLPSYFEEEVTDTNNKKNKQIFTILPSIKIGNLTFEKIGCVVMDIKTSELKCYGFDGIIGANLLAKMAWQFDYTKQEIRATSNFENFKQDYDFVISFQYNNQKTPKINGKILDKNLVFTLDTGYSGNLSINNDSKYYSSNIDKNNFIKIKGINAIGLYGYDELKDNFILKSDIEFGESIIAQEIIKSGNSNLIGNEFLKHYLFSIDWKNKKIYLKNINKQKEPIKSFGFTYIFKDNNAIVISKFENKNIPIQLNDRILKINNTDFTKLPTEKICEYSTNKIEDNLNQIEITVERNNKILSYKLTKEEFLK